jgi:hypothetical protein
MHATDSPDAAHTDLEKLAVELANLGLHATLTIPASGMPCLTVRNSQVGTLTETVRACEDSFWWSWSEPIAPCDQPTQAATLLAQVLRIAGE